MAQRWAVVRLLTPACITPRSRGRRAPARPRSPGSHPGSTTAKAATGRCSRRPRAADVSPRLRLAIPNKGRLVEPTLRLLHDAGLVFDEHDRMLVAKVQNYDLDILFVRTNDIIEFVGDGVADLGVTGDDLISESGAELPRIRSLGYGRCRLAAAVPNDSPYQTVGRPRRAPRRDGAPEHRPPVLRGAADRRRDHPDLGRRRGRAAARAGRGDRRPGLHGFDAGHERAAPGRRRPGVGGRARGQSDRASRARRGARGDRHDALRRHRRARSQVPDDERPGDDARPRSRACSRRSNRRR